MAGENTIQHDQLVDVTQRARTTGTRRRNDAGRQHAVRGDRRGSKARRLGRYQAFEQTIRLLAPESNHQRSMPRPFEMVESFDEERGFAAARGAQDARVAGSAFNYVGDGTRRGHSGRILPELVRR